jgi:hypothetical protein
MQRHCHPLAGLALIDINRAIARVPMPVGGGIAAPVRLGFGTRFKSKRHAPE